MRPPPPHVGGASIEQVANAALALQERLDELGSRSIVVPVKYGTKEPAIAEHKGGAWSRLDAIKWFAGYIYRPVFLGVLLMDEFVIDFDTNDLYKSMCKTFPELKEAPTERTKKGMHVFFRRTPEMETMTDGPLRDPKTHEKLNIDFKTHTNSMHNGEFTKGLVVVTPSTDKSWLPGRSIHEVPVPYPSDALVAWIRERLRVRKIKASIGQEHVPSKGAVAEPPLSYVIGGVAARVAGFDELVIKPIDSCDKADVVRKLDGELKSRISYWASSAFSGFSFKAGGQCPCCGRSRPHNNQYYTVHRPDGVRRLHNHGCPNGMIVPYTVTSTAAYQNRWRAAADIAFKKVSPALAEALSPCVAGLSDRTAVAAWFDTDTGVFYAELRTPAGLPEFAAVGIDSELGPSWIERSNFASMRVSERPNSFGDLGTKFGARKVNPEPEEFEKFKAELRSELDV